MPHYRKLVGEQCYLSPVSAEDAELWAAWDNDLSVTIPLGDEAYTEYGLERERDAVASVIGRQDHFFSIVTCDTDEVIGRVLLFNLNPTDRCAMLGIVIGEKAYWGQGYGQEAVRLMLDYAFNLLNLHSIMLGVFAFNERAIACYQKVGFREIGRRRQARIIGGHAYDEVLMDILASEFESFCVAPLLAPVVE
jgi:RimJ/RimL family protein N-acetyltransferase